MMNLTQEQVNQAIYELRTDMEMSSITILIMINGYNEGQPTVETKIVKTRKGKRDTSIDSMYEKAMNSYISVMVDVYRDFENGKTGEFAVRSKMIKSPELEGSVNMGEMIDFDQLKREVDDMDAATMKHLKETGTLPRGGNFYCLNAVGPVGQKGLNEDTTL